MNLTCVLCNNYTHPDSNILLCGHCYCESCSMAQSVEVTALECPKCLPLNCISTNVSSNKTNVNENSKQNVQQQSYSHQSLPANTSSTNMCQTCHHSTVIQATCFECGSLCSMCFKAHQSLKMFSNHVFLDIVSKRIEIISKLKSTNDDSHSLNRLKETIAANFISIASKTQINREKIEHHLNVSNELFENAEYEAFKTVKNVISTMSCGVMKSENSLANLCKLYYQKNKIQLESILEDTAVMDNSTLDKYLRFCYFFSRSKPETVLCHGNFVTLSIIDAVDKNNRQYRITNFFNSLVKPFPISNEIIRKSTQLVMENLKLVNGNDFLLLAPTSPENQFSFSDKENLSNSITSTMTFNNFKQSLNNGISVSPVTSDVAAIASSTDSNIDHPVHKKTTSKFIKKSFKKNAKDKSESCSGLSMPSHIRRLKMCYTAKIGHYGVNEGQFNEPNGVAISANGDIVVADTNNHRVQVFDSKCRFMFQFGGQGKRDGQMLYPNRVAVSPLTNNYIITERTPLHQIQVFDKNGSFVRKFGSNVLEHPRGLCLDKNGNIIVVECKLMRIVIFSQTGKLKKKFSAEEHLLFPNNVCVGLNDDIFICDNRDHCVKVFDYNGNYICRIGGKGITNYPIAVNVNYRGEILVYDNHNNFNLTVFNQNGTLINAFESRIKHAQCFEVTLFYTTIVVTCKDHKVYFYDFH